MQTALRCLALILVLSFLAFTPSPGFAKALTPAVGPFGTREQPPA